MFWFTPILDRWPFNEELIDVMPSMKADNEFTVTTKKAKDSKKTVSITFSTLHRTDLLSALQHHRSKFVSAAGATQDPVFSAFKHHWSDSRKEVMLCPLNSSFVQLGSTGKPIARYWYKGIEAICLVSDYPGGFCIFYGGSGRMHLFALEKKDELLRRMTDAMMR